MRSVRLALDEDLIDAVDCAAKQLQMTRSAFISEALHEARSKYGVARMEQQHRAGYETHPVTADEFCFGEDEQCWGDP